jgi:hypothetical protein
VLLAQSSTAEAADPSGLVFAFKAFHMIVLPVCGMCVIILDVPSVPAL